jgi:hypothetical protein
MDDKGKVRVACPFQRTQTPLEKLASLPEAEQNLKPSVRLCDNEAFGRKGKPSGYPVAQ